MGVPVNAQKQNDSEYVRSVKAMCRIVVKRLFSAVKNSDFLYSFTKDCAKEQKSLKVLHSFTESVIDQRIKQQSQGDPDENKNVDGIGRKKKLAFLDLLLQCKVDGKPLTRRELREEVDTFMFEVMLCCILLQ